LENTRLWGKGGDVLNYVGDKPEMFSKARPEKYGQF
jgi:hypothetical protein